MDNLIKPNFQTRPYKPTEVVRIKDRLQQFLYIKHGAKPVDMYVSSEDDCLIMLFMKSETKELYEKWRMYALK